MSVTWYFLDRMLSVCVCVWLIGLAVVNPKHLVVVVVVKLVAVDDATVCKQQANGLNSSNSVAFLDGLQLFSSNMPFSISTTDQASIGLVQTSMRSVEPINESNRRTHGPHFSKVFCSSS